MKRLAFLAAACVLGTSACSTHAPTDAELVTLLHREGAVDANAPLDAGAVQCLRTWSGDASLTRDLAPAVLADAAKARCRGALDGWIADAKRNPAKFDFAQVSSPEVTRRAMALLAAHAPAGEAAHAAAAATAPAATPRTRPEPGPGPEIEAPLARASDLCEEAKSLTATDKSDVRLNRFVEYCASAPAAATRASVDRMKAAGDNAGIDQTARRVASSNAVVEGLLRNHKR
jgi:hypothetical protein